MTTLGELITMLFDRLQRLYGDEHLAALATQERVNDVLRRRTRVATRARRRAAASGEGWLRVNRGSGSR